MDVKDSEAFGSRGEPETDRRSNSCNVETAAQGSRGSAAV